MSIWTKINAAIASLGLGEGLLTLLERFRAAPERSTAFTIAVIALGAKMAKADGLVTRDEVAAFREVFVIDERESANAARLFNLARQDVAGYDAYARKIRTLFPDRTHRVLGEVIESLFHVAMADGTYHAAEDAFLAEVAGILGLSEAEFRKVRARAVPDAHPDPFDVLGVTREHDLAAIRKVWKTEVRACHPDRLRARGLPEEAIVLAEQRLQVLNRAMDEIEHMRVGAENADRHI